MSVLYLPEEKSDSVIDVSHYQNIINWPDVVSKNPMLRGVIAKATQGSRHRDPCWDYNAANIGPTGLLPGAYHFCTDDDPVEQVQNFLGTVQPVLGVLIALDWEEDPGGNTAELATVAQMVRLVHDRVGRYPVIYLGRWKIRVPAPTLAQCDLWLPSYGHHPICPPGWSHWRLWQHTDGAIGDATGPIAGIGLCDRSYYDETHGPLEEWWGR